MSQFSTLLLNNPSAGANSSVLQAGTVKAATSGSTAGSSKTSIDSLNQGSFENIVDNILPELTTENIALLQLTGSILPSSTQNTLLVQSESQKVVPNNLNINQPLLNVSNVSGQNLPASNIQQGNIISNLDISEAINQLNVNIDGVSKTISPDSTQKLQNSGNFAYSKQNVTNQILTPIDPLKEQSTKQILSRLPQNYGVSNVNTISENIATQQLVPAQTKISIGENGTKNLNVNTQVNQGSVLQNELNLQTLDKQNILASIARETSPDSELVNKNVLGQSATKTNNIQNTVMSGVNLNNGVATQHNVVNQYNSNILANNANNANNNADFVNIQNSLNIEQGEFDNDSIITDNKIVQQISSESKTDQINAKSAEAKLYTSASEQISLKINKALKNNDTKIEIQLDPAKLGKVSIQIDLAKEGKSSVVIMVEKAETLELLKADSKSLEKALQNAGLNTDSNSLNFGLKGQNKQFSSYENDNNSSNNQTIEEELDSLAKNESNYIGYQSNRALDIRA